MKNRSQCNKNKKVPLLIPRTFASYKHPHFATKSSGGFSLTVKLAFPPVNPHLSAYDPEDFSIESKYSGETQNWCTLSKGSLARPYPTQVVARTYKYHRNHSVTQQLQGVSFFDRVQSGMHCLSISLLRQFHPCTNYDVSRFRVFRIVSERITLYNDR